MSHHIFIADDDEDDHFLLQRAFSQQCPQCHLQFAEDGLQLLDALALSTYVPNLILLDLNMPRLSGLETLQILRHDNRYHHIPIVMLTTSSCLYDRKQAFGLGASDFVTKPMLHQEWNKMVGQLKTKWLAET